MRNSKVQRRFRESTLDKGGTEMNLFHTMGFAGSVAVIIYMLSYLYTKQHLPIVWHKIYLTITIVLFLIPFPYFCMDYGAWVRKLLRAWKFLQSNGGQINNSSYSIHIYRNGIYIYNELIYVLAIIFGLISICLMVCVIINYRKTQRMIWDCSTISTEETDFVNLLDGFAGVKVYRCSELDVPVATGLLFGKIVLPDVKFREDRLKDVLNHELTHIKVKDNLVKMLLLAVVILNFYNPLVYFLWKRWNIIAEMYCDETVLLEKNTQQMKDYANMVVDFAAGKYANKVPFMGLGKNTGEKELKERIKNMKKSRKTFGLLSKVAGTFLIVAGVFASSLTAAAYQPVDVEHFNTNYDANKVQTIFIENKTTVSIHEQENCDVHKIETYITAEKNQIFVDENGNVYYDNEIQPHSTCTHDYVNGTHALHYTYSDGHCRVEYYSGKRCSKCGDLVFGDHISTQTFDKCPH